MIDSRFRTYFNLIDSVNKLDNFYNNFIHFMDKICTLKSDDQQKMALFDGDNSNFSQDDFNSEWYQLYESIKNFRSDMHINNMDIIRMSVILSALILSLHKDKILARNHKDLILKISIDEFNRIMNNFFDKRGTKYYLGSIEFDDAITAFDYLRNKLLHGEFEIVGNEIVISKDGKKGTFGFQKLNSLCMVVSELQNCSKDEYRDKFYLINSSNKNISIDEDFITKKVYQCEIIVKIKDSRKISYSLINIINSLKNVIKEINSMPGISSESALKYAFTPETYKVLRKNKCEVEYKLTPVVFEDKDKKLLEAKYREHVKYGAFDFLSAQELMDYMVEISKNKNFDFIYKELKKFLFMFMNNMAEDKNNKFDPKNIELGKKLLKFYCMYQYGLEKIINQGNGTLLKKIISGDSFDFSKLDLSDFECTSMTNEIVMGDFEQQKEGIINEFNQAEEKYLKKQYNYEYCRDIKKLDESVLEKLKSEADFFRDKFYEKKAFKEKVDAFDYDKYQKNINIVNHIRNAISHGNYFINQYVDENGKVVNKITFEDIYDGVLTYSVTINIEKLDKLFRDIDFNNYLEKLSESVCGKTIDRVSDEIVLDNKGVIIEDKYDEWIQYTNKVLDSGNKDEIRILKIAMEFMQEIASPTCEDCTFGEYIDLIGKSIATVFTFSAMKQENRDTRILEVFNYKLSVTDYEKVISIIFYFFDSYVELKKFLKRELYPISEEGSFIRKLFDYENSIDNFVKLVK